MEKLWLKIIENKANPVNWPLRALLWLASLCYRAGLLLRVVFVHSTVRPRAPTVSIGNLTVGGAGKTPVTIELARRLLASGRKVGIVSSGYGRTGRKAIVGIGKELQKYTVEEIGDEVMMMAECLPDAYFALESSKSKAARKLDVKNPDVILVDDGYQHRRLHRDCNILLIDARLDLRRECLFPLGKLREPLSASGRADAIILTKTNLPGNNPGFVRYVRQHHGNRVVAEAEFSNGAIVAADTRINWKDIGDSGVYLFAGIAEGRSFIEQVHSRV
ncbi:MAG: tetraacyldisaccharide 4'-kinase, partial [Candidatus Zixiibacteriota bacterium]